MVRGSNQKANKKANKKAGPPPKDNTKQLAIVFAVLVVVMIFYYIPIISKSMKKETLTTEEVKLRMEQRENLRKANRGENPDGAVSDTAMADDPLAELGGSISPDNAQPKNVSVDPDVEIMTSKDKSDYSNQKRVAIAVADSVRANPFLPAGEDLAASLPKFDLLAPPETLQEGSDASKVINTTISGILYDQYNPSAIINIGGSDYLVKRGDSVNNYKILSITRDQVTVKLGNNVYRAGVGELLKLDEINHNSIDHLNRKFGGNTADVSINVRKRTY